MRRYIGKRLLTALMTLALITLVVFFVIQLPPGDYVDHLVVKMVAEGEVVTDQDIYLMRQSYGLDQPFFLQYLRWLGGIVTGDWGTSFDNNQKVLVVIGETLGATLMISLVTMVFTYIISIPIAIYSAKHQYSIGDYIVTFIGFIGVAAPGFLVAIVLMFLSYRWFGTALMGLFPDGGIRDWAGVVYFLSHLIIPILVIGLNGTCGLIRSLRAMLLDEMSKPYILCARAKGVSERTITYKYMMRAVLNPIVSGLAGMISSIFNGSTITAIVLMLPTQGPVLLKALKSQDVFLSGGILLISAVLVVLGTLLSDILLGVLDPRIKVQEAGK